jgi:hypothetical protein
MRFQVKVHAEVRADVRAYLTEEGAQKVEAFVVSYLSEHA